MLHKVALRAGIDPKKCYPYAFRHRWASIMASKISNAALEQVMGWVPGSDMHKVYQHMNPNAASDEIRRAYGMKPRDETVLKVEEQVCPVCGYVNPPDAIHCLKCGNYLKQDVAITNMSKDIDSVSKAMAEAIKGGDLNKAIEGLAQLILKAEYEKKRKR